MKLGDADKVINLHPKDASLSLSIKTEVIYIDELVVMARCYMYFDGKPVNEPFHITYEIPQGCTNESPPAA